MTNDMCGIDLTSPLQGLNGIGDRQPRASAKAASRGFRLCPGLSSFAPLGLKIRLADATAVSPPLRLKIWLAGATPVSAPLRLKIRLADATVVFAPLGLKTVFRAAPSTLAWPGSRNVSQASARSSVREKDFRTQLHKRCADAGRSAFSAAACLPHRAGSGRATSPGKAREDGGARESSYRADAWQQAPLPDAVFAPEASHNGETTVR